MGRQAGVAKQVFGRSPANLWNTRMHDYQRQMRRGALERRCYDASFTSGIFRLPPRIDGGCSFGQYIRIIRMNSSFGAGSQFNSLSLLGDSSPPGQVFRDRIWNRTIYCDVPTPPALAFPGIGLAGPGVARRRRRR